jgi:hypothetical protein
MICLSIHQRSLVAKAAADLSEQQRGEVVTEVAVRLSQFRRYSDADVSRAVRLALRALATDGGVSPSSFRGFLANETF